MGASCEKPCCARRTSAPRYRCREISAARMTQRVPGNDPPSTSPAHGFCHKTVFKSSWQEIGQSGQPKSEIFVKGAVRCRHCEERSDDPPTLARRASEGLSPPKRGARREA